MKVRGAPERQREADLALQLARHGIAGRAEPPRVVCQLPLGVAGRLDILCIWDEARYAIVKARVARQDDLLQVRRYQDALRETLGPDWLIVAVLAAPRFGAIVQAPGPWVSTWRLPA